MKKILVFLLLLLFSPPVFATNYSIQQSVMTISGSASVQDATVIPSSLVPSFTWVSVQLTGTWTGTVTWEVSNDNTNWSPVALIVPSSVGGGMISTATTNGTYHGPKGSFLYFRARLSTVGSGTVQGLASFSPNASAIQAKGDTTGQCVGTVTSFNVSGGTTGLTFTGGPITSSGTITATGTAMAIGGDIVGATPFSTLFVDGSGNLGEFLLPTVDLTAQTAAIPATTMYTTVTAGMYRISYTAKVTTVASTSSTLGGFQVIYTDATDSVVVTTVAGTTSTLNTTQAQVSGAVVVYAKAATDIQYVFGYVSNSAAQMAYNLHIKVEKM